MKTRLFEIYNKRTQRWVCERRLTKKQLNMMELNGDLITNYIG